MPQQHSTCIQTNKIYSFQFWLLPKGPNKVNGNNIVGTIKLTTLYFLKDIILKINTLNTNWSNASKYETKVEFKYAHIETNLGVTQNSLFTQSSEEMKKYVPNFRSAKQNHYVYMPKLPLAIDNVNFIM